MAAAVFVIFPFVPASPGCLTFPVTKSIFTKAPFVWTALNITSCPFRRVVVVVVVAAAGLPTMLWLFSSQWSKWANSVWCRICSFFPDIFLPQVGLCSIPTWTTSSSPWKDLKEAIFLAAGSDSLAQYLAEKPLYVAASSQEAEPGQLRSEWLCNSPSWRCITVGIMHYVLRDNGNHDNDDDDPSRPRGLQ